MKTLKFILKAILFLALLAVPAALRWVSFHPGGYQAPELPTLDAARIVAPTAEYQDFTDQPQPGDARVLIDQAHGNNLQVDDLTTLLDRLADRGIPTAVYSYDSNSLEQELKRATAFVVLAPTYPFYREEADLVQEFVANGGLLFLVADPTRSVPTYSDYGYIDLYSLFFPESAVPAANSLANRFGVSFFEDYLYNITDYDGNYRNVKYTSFAAHSLTSGLKQVTFFAAHSLKSDGEALFIGDEATLSNVRTGEAALSPAALAADGRVLALGDISVLLSPYNRSADNDQFVSNIADWLSVSQRSWRVQDYPYFFRQPIDLTIRAAKEDAPLPSAVFDAVGPLQQSLAWAGYTVQFAEQAQPGHDWVYAATYGDLELVQDILASAGVSVTLATSGDDATPTPTPTPEAGEEPVEQKSTLSIQGAGTFDISGTLLFLLAAGEDRSSLVILGEDDAALLAATERLYYLDFSGCVRQQQVLLCTTEPAYIAPEPVSTPDAGSAPQATGGVLILAIDRGNGRSSAPEWEYALSGLYDDVTVWSVSAQGIPSYEDIEGYDVYIMDLGDYAYDSALMQEMPYIDSNMLLIGEQFSDPAYATLEPAAVYDLQLGDSTHPLAAGFDPGAPTALLESSSGVPALAFTPLEEPVEGVNVIFLRGPDSPYAGNPLMVTFDYPQEGIRNAYAGFAFYRLPEDLQLTFAGNMVEWLWGN